MNFLESMNSKMKLWTVCLILLDFLLLEADASIVGGECYSYAQKNCHTEWTNLIVSQQNKQNSEICRFFGAVHTCTLKYMSDCNFDKHEKELYERDIVGIYTHKPYSCALIGGNLQYRAEYKGNGASHPTVYLFILILPAIQFIK